MRGAKTFKSEKLANKRMAQDKQANSMGQDSVVHLLLMDKEHSFEDNNEHILDRENIRFERGLKVAFQVKNQHKIDDEDSSHIRYL